MLVSAAALLFGASLAAAQASVTDLVGTWSSKSNSTFTGPGFYDPVKDEMIEPKLTGISYSFTADGFYEEAYYRAIASPTNPKCPKGIMQWQHGSYQKLDNGSLLLQPIRSDGRQLYSDPCAYKSSIYTRYHTNELFSRYSSGIDGYTKKTRLDLYKADGAPLMPLYLAYSPPQMLPTTTLNPLATATATGKVKRSYNPLKLDIKRTRDQQQVSDFVWWLGAFLTATGGTLWYFF